MKNDEKGDKYIQALLIIDDLSMGEL